MFPLSFAGDSAPHRPLSIVYAVRAYLPLWRRSVIVQGEPVERVRVKPAVKGVAMSARDAAWGEAMEASAQGDEWEDGAIAEEVSREESAGHAPALARAHRVVKDDLYGAIPVSRWAQSLLDLAPFRRLDGVSLSDIPGQLLFGRPFPSRLTHSRGVYYLTRLARPRDRALQAAALAHDLGHGPFSHLTEPLMLEWLGIDHEQRSAMLLRESVARLLGQSARLLTWLDLDEVCELITGSGSDARGVLLNGLVDYDNLDHVARFSLASGLGEPGYDGRALARGLRITPSADVAPHVTLEDDLRDDALAWQADRAKVFQFLQSDSWNVAAHAMLRKAIDLAARDGMLDGGFFDETDAGALQFLRRSPSSRALIERVLMREPYAVIWEADAPPEQSQIEIVFAHWRQRLDLEERIAAESGLHANELVAQFVVSRALRPLPPFAAQAIPSDATPTKESPPELFVRILTPAGIGQDYIRRARMAAERAFGALGANPRGWPELR